MYRKQLLMSLSIPTIPISLNKQLYHRSPPETTIWRSRATWILSPTSYLLYQSSLAHIAAITATMILAILLLSIILVVELAGSSWITPTITIPALTSLQRSSDSNKEQRRVWCATYIFNLLAQLSLFGTDKNAFKNGDENLTVGRYSLTINLIKTKTSIFPQ